MFTTLMFWLVGIAIILLCRKVCKRSRELQLHADELTREYYGLSSEVSDLGRLVRHTLPEMQISLLKQMNNLRFEPHMTIKHALAIHPDVNQVLDIGGGGCSGGGAYEHETIREAAEIQARSLDEVMQQLNGLLDGTTKVLPRSADGFVSLDSILSS